MRSGACHIRLLLFSVLICSFCVGSPAGEKKGKWNGDFSLSAGSNFISGKQFNKVVTRGVNDFSGKFGYSADKWNIKFDLSNSYDNTVSFLSGLTYDTDAAGEKYKIYTDTTIRSSANEKVFAGVSLTVFTSPSDKLDFYYNCNFNYENPQKVVASTSFDQDMDWSKKLLYKLTQEESSLCKMNYNFGGQWDHRFASASQSFLLRADGGLLFDNRWSEWEKGNSSEETLSDYEIDQITRETPKYKKQFIGMAARFSDTRLANVNGLELTGTLDVQYNRNFDDLCTEKFMDHQWIDTLTFTEKFDYLTVTVDPRLHMRYRGGRFDVQLDYCPEYYAYRLSSDKYFGSMQSGRLAHLGGINVSFLPSEHHIIKASATSSIKRPTYLNLCWFRRSGTYSNEFIEGNPDLLPETSNKLSLSYEFKWRHFSTVASLGNTYAFDKIEKTFNNYNIDGHSCRVYTWINAGWSNTLNGKLTVRWNGNALFAELTGDINQVNNVSKDNVSKKNMDYKVSGKLKCFVKSWTFAVQGNYQSKITKIYSYMTQYVGLSARVDKRLGKFSVFVEGKDLLDRPIETYTFSEDYLHGRCESDNKNRRAYYLGLRFQF